MKRIALLLTTLLLAAVSAGGQAVLVLGNSHAMLHVDVKDNYLLLPVQESVDNANVKVISSGKQLQSFNIRLAQYRVDYFVPLYLRRFATDKVLMDVSFNGKDLSMDAVRNFLCWKVIVQDDAFDTANRERFRPIYHHTPAYGWMNDPNGMFYKDGVYHLFYQWNPYGSQWENMTWGHSVSRDLVHWEARPAAIEPDALGTIFSGSCVVDRLNSSGFGTGAVIAFYTSAGQNQTQSMAYSTDNGDTFTKYVSNPVITEPAIAST